MFVDGDQQDLWEVGLCSLLKATDGLMLCDNNISIDHVSYIITFTCRAVISPCKSDDNYFHLRLNLGSKDLLCFFISSHNFSAHLPPYS